MLTASLAAAAAEPGRIEGTVIVGPHLSGERLRFSLYPRAGAPVPTGELDPQREVENVVIYLESPPAVAAIDGPATARMEQRRLSFEPRTLAVARGTTVEFPNRDSVFHNVFSLSKAASFDLGRYPAGNSKSVRFDRTGLVKVYCHIHSDMSASILVLDHPFFAQPDASGRFAIEGIAPGDYRVAAWHERAELSVRRVHVASGRTATVDFEIPLVTDERD